VGGAQDRRARWDLREPQAKEVFGELSRAALNILELTDWAWHDVYGEPTPSERVITDMFACSQGDIGKFAYAANEAVKDRRNVHVWADQVRARERQAERDGPGIT
jgi:hypothetical protein